ncbi:bifunctional phosphopantothenoylcysteine decarboxylase/phosphopantothenate--cysteine ligase CoaBC [bacterium]|nr:bifunctional phosphopantothenoylcysteine decarboxylase/phosphopantothenate--cysteine ligase CoaBC [bacterium]
MTETNAPATAEMQLRGRTILLGVCGGIAAYKACDLARLFIKAGAEVRVILTRRAAAFVTPLTFSALTGQPALMDEFPAPGGQPDPAVDVYSHLNLPRGVDCMVIAPATADMLGKMAHGLADDLLSSAYLANAAPVVLAPAMNVRMWEHPAVQANLETLRGRGHLVMEPGTGMLACGDEGKGRLADIDFIAAMTGGLINSDTQIQSIDMDAAAQGADLADSAAKPLAGRRFVVSAGATREYLDPVRFITNASSGTLGLKVCEALLARGAVVDLVACGGMDVPAALLRRLASVDTAMTAFDLQLLLQGRLPEVDGLVMLAAVADYGPTRYSGTKRKKDGAAWNLELAQTEDVLASLRPLRRADQVIAAVSLEDTDWLARGQRKAAAKGADVLLAVELSAELPFGEKRMHCALVSGEGVLAPDDWRSKEDAAALLADAVAARLKASV